MNAAIWQFQKDKMKVMESSSLVAKGYGWRDSVPTKHDGVLGGFLIVVVVAWV